MPMAVQIWVRSCFVFVSLITSSVYAQNVAINATGNAPNASALLDMDGTNKGLLIPRVTYCHRVTPACSDGMLDGSGNLAAAAQGLLVYQTDGSGDGEGFYYNTSSTTTPTWVKLFGGSPSSGWELSGNAGTTTGTNFLGTTDAVDLAIYTNNTEKIRVNGVADANEGFVGIGTSTPGQTLDVAGDVEIGGGAADYDGSDEFLHINSRNQDWYIGVKNLATANLNDFHIGLTQAEDGIFHIEPGGNIGIGIAAPTFKLHVLQATNGEHAVYGHNSSAGTGGHGIWGQVDGTLPAYSALYGVATAGAQALMTDGPTYLNHNGNDYDLVVEGLNDGNLLMTDASNDRVGIGSNSPSAKLYVRIPSSITGTQDRYVIRSYLLHGSGSGTSNLRGAYLQAKSNSHSGTNNIYGSYGMAEQQQGGAIGGNNPAGDVYGQYGYGYFNGNNSSGTGTPTSVLYGVYGKGEFEVNSTGGAMNPSTTIYGVRGEGKFTVTAGSTTPTVTTYGVYGTAAGTTAGTQTGVGGYFSATGSNNNYAGIFDMGFVGVGITSPTYRLHVYDGTVGAVPAIYGENTQPGGEGVRGVANVIAGRGVHGMTTHALGIAVYGEATTNGTTGVQGESAAAGGWGVRGQNSSTGVGVEGMGTTGIAGKFTLSGAGTSIISAFDGATEVFTVDDGGNVGIGTTSPDGKLDIEDGGLYLSEIAAPATPNATKGVVYEKTDNLLYFKNDAGTEYDLTAGGGDADWTIGIGEIYNTTDNVGIGTTSPLDPLHILSDATGDAIHLEENSGGEDWQLGIDISGDLNFEDSGTPRVTFEDGGEVGFGTTTPSANFEVYENTSSTSPMVEIQQAGSGDAAMRFITTGNTFSIGVDNSDADKFKISDNTTLTSNARLTIDAAGNVGIGTTTPAYKLEVSTDDAAKLTTTTWTISSDKRLKKNIKPFSDGLDVLMKINPVTYEYNGMANIPDGSSGIGVIAQEIREVAPYTVGTFKRKMNEDDDEATELYNFNSHALFFVLINSVQELKAENDALRARLVALERYMSPASGTPSTDENLLIEK